MTVGRLERRKAQTRTALIAAARALLVERDPAGVSIQEITDAADVGFGSFYNHFPSKQELFDLAVASVADEHRAMIARATAGLSDPAEALAVAVRITARFPRTHPSLARIIDRAGVGYPGAYAIDDLRHARDVGRLCYDDDQVAFACVAGAVLGVLHHGLDVDDPAEIDERADRLAVSLLRMFGLVEGDARKVVARPLPAWWPAALAEPDRGAADVAAVGLRPGRDWPAGKRS
ncbi:TetR/AcrR family transcriptional regulator [Actinoplanes sp. NEAU-A12]|uniref:TetR/AcrR family transcriptional regulator n=1 Tax=Actinoplanes sandaracinus TaxID=3045177 RepID=A0ABT6WR16_9ACTN|nr:TetR/AcrR family transcriptional regulator [Actinoplanes sandaracinus]MDI6102181.1 TetR/AcrR family transcriptional regulator [Actinoplanes sandaracinus]